MRTHVHKPTKWLIASGIFLLCALLIFNGTSSWIRDNGGLASWLQAIGSLYAIIAVSFPVFLERGLSMQRARATTLASAQMACDLMAEVADFAFNPDAAFSEWWVPQWHVIDEVMASCPIHEIGSSEALRAFVTIRELYGRMRAWDEANSDPWPLEGGMQSYVGVLMMNASMQLDCLREAIGDRASVSNDASSAA